MMLQHPQAQPPAAEIPGQHLLAELLITGDVARVSALTAGLRRFSGR